MFNKIKADRLRQALAAIKQVKIKIKIQSPIIIYKLGAPVVPETPKKKYTSPDCP